MAKVESFSTVWDFSQLRVRKKVEGIVAKLVRRLMSQDRAIANARAAATHLARCRVERVEIELYLTELTERRAATRSA